MKKVSLLGLFNGSNTLFTLPELSVSGGVTLLVHTNLFLHATAGAPGIGEYRLVGNQVTVGLAPNPADVLYAFITTSLATSLMPVVLTGVQNSLNTTFTCPNPPVPNANLLVLLAGNVLTEATSVDAVGEFYATASSVGTTLTLGLAPSPTDVLMVYTEISTVTPLTQLTFIPVTSTDVLTSATTSIGTTPLLLVLYTGVALNETLTAPTPNEYLSIPTQAGLQVRFGLPYVDSDRIDLYLLAYAAVSAEASGVTYEIFQNIYALGPEVEYIFSMVSHTPMRETSVFMLDRVDPNRNQTGDHPTAFAYRGRDAQGRLLIEVYPVPSTASLIRYAGIRRDACVDQAHVLRQLDALVLNAATAAVFLMIVAKTGTPEPWQTLAQLYQGKADRLLERLLDLDFTRSGVAQVQGMREDSGFDTGVYLGAYDADWWIR
jgi:hypothetical protein